MRPLRETLASIKTWAILAGDVEDLAPHIPAEAVRYIDFPASITLETAKEWIERLSSPGDLVLNTRGQANVGRACLQLGRRYLGIVAPGVADVLKEQLTHEEKTCRKS